MRPIKGLVVALVKSGPLLKVRCENGMVLEVEPKDGLGLYDRVDVLYDFGTMMVRDVVRHERDAITHEVSASATESENQVDPDTLGPRLCGLAPLDAEHWGTEPWDPGPCGLAPLVDGLWGPGEALEMPNDNDNAHLWE
jgi:hypothetical protein